MSPESKNNSFVEYPHTASISQLLWHLGTKFQRLPPCFRGPGSRDTLAVYGYSAKLLFFDSGLIVDIFFQRVSEDPL